MLKQRLLVLFVDWRRRTSIRSLLSQVITGILATGLVSVGVGVYLLVRHVLVVSAAQSAHLHLESVWSTHGGGTPAATRTATRSHRWVLPSVRGGPAELQSLSADLASHRFFSACIRDPAGNVMATAGALSSLPLPDGLLDSARQFQVDSPSSRHLHFFTETPEARWLVLVIPLERDGAFDGVVEYAVEFRIQDRILRSLSFYLCIFSLAIIVVGLLAARGLAWVLWEPLERVAHTARRVTDHDDLEARTGLEPGRNETLLVASTFDQMLDRLQESFATQRRFVADASHELKTPVAAILGMAEMLQSPAVKEADRKRATDTIVAESERMSSLVSNLLTLSRFETGADLRRGPVDLSDIITNCVSRASLYQANLHIECDCHEPVLAHGEVEGLTCVLRNLLENAIHYTPPRGTIRLSARIEGERAVVVVEDTGAGIAPEHLPHVFERFYRADSSRSRKTGGTGLGLSIVHTIVTNLGGTVSIESTVGVGTTVTCSLPRWQGAASEVISL